MVLPRLHHRSSVARLTNAGRLRTFARAHFRLVLCFAIVGQFSSHSKVSIYNLPLFCPACLALTPTVPSLSKTSSRAALSNRGSALTNFSAIEAARKEQLGVCAVLGDHSRFTSLVCVPRLPQLHAQGHTRTQD